MKNIKIHILLLILILTQASVYAAVDDTTKNDVNAVADSISKFAFNLYARIKDLSAVQNKGGNLFFSPYSISTALAMTYTGARGNTADEMANVLQLPALELERIAAAYGQLQKQMQADPETFGYQLNVANALWGQQGFDFLPEFLELNKTHFGSGLNEVNFMQSEQTRQIINAWIEEQTKQKIKDLITPGSIDSMTRLVLTNAIYFKGDWDKKFEESNTETADFRIDEDTTVEVQMMYQEDSFDYGESDIVQVLQMPYIGKELAMMLILPKEGVSLETIEEQMSENSSAFIGSVNKYKREIQVYLPRFKITCGTLELNKMLAEMGMSQAFTDVADFSGMDGRGDLCISNVMHKAFVEVNEEGTEAAAATAVGIRLTAVLEPPPVFRADRPFIFIILDTRLNCPLFMGRLVNPVVQE